MTTMFDTEIDHIATGSESLREFAFNAGADNLDRCWLLDDRDVWVKNPHYTGKAEPHPEDEQFDEAFLAEIVARNEAERIDDDADAHDYMRAHEAGAPLRGVKSIGNSPLGLAVRKARRQTS